MSDNLYLEKVNDLESTLGLREKSPTELFYEKPCELTLRDISKRIQTPEMVQLAVENDGIALRSTSKKLITVKLCETAVKQNGLALSYVPKSILETNPFLYSIAVENDGRAIQYVPENYITPQITLKAVSQVLNLKYDDFYKYPIYYIPKQILTEELVRISIQYSPNSIRDIPESFLTKELYHLAVSGNGLLLQLVPAKFKDKEMIATAVASNPIALQYVIPSKCTKKLCALAFNSNPFVIQWIPEKYITREMCLAVIEEFREGDRSKFFSIGWFPDPIRNDRKVIDLMIQKIGARRILSWNYGIIAQIKEYGKFAVPTRPLSKTNVKYLQAIVDSLETPSERYIQFDKTGTPPPAKDAILVKTEDSNAHIYNLSVTKDNTVRTIHYITDIHIEHQIENLLENGKVDREKIIDFIDTKIDELISSISGQQGYLLIGGDVGHTKSLVTLFYRKLTNKWNGKIIAILGNHELWDDHAEGILGGYVSRPMDEIIDDYRSRMGRATLLQNQMFVIYKNRRSTVVSEELILRSSEEELRDLLSKSTFILLGGIGFSGLNPKYNAKMGLYRSAVPSLDEDIELTNRFRRVYDKVNSCAGDMQVIVLTHTPVYDWTSEPCNPNWVYINGHTHQNSLIRKKDGTTVLSDNQVGYNPSKWKLNAFTLAGWYDPFRTMKDGIHEITSEMYKDFNLGRGIQSNGCKYDGTIYVLKRNGYYMFLLRSTYSLCLLAGGQRKRLSNSNVKYYYDRMEQYALKVKAAVLPYQNAITAIANEIELIGGWGIVHGCIVDIDWFNHIYLNPYDGKVTPYFAYDISSRITYPDLPSLLKDRLPFLLGKFLSAQKQNTIPLLTQYALSKKKIKGQKPLATIPQLVLGTEMYKPSRIMKSIQYIFDDNIIRIWNDEILSADFESNPSILSIEDLQNK